MYADDDMMTEKIDDEMLIGRGGQEEGIEEVGSLNLKVSSVTMDKLKITMKQECE